MMQTNPVFLTVVNPAVTSPPVAVIYTGVSATLNLTLTNNSGSVIGLQAGTVKSQFQVFFPFFFTSVELQNVTLTPPADWQCVYDPNTLSLNVTYEAAQPASWLNGGTLLFECTGVETSATPTSGGIQINPLNLTGSYPSEIPATLTVLPQPNHNNLDLPDVLQLSLEAQGSVYVSASTADPLANTLFLTLMNVSGGKLFTGTSWPATAAKPLVTVSYIYGYSPGALAADNGNNVGSAWSITPGIATSEGNNWQVGGPSSGPGKTPVSWSLTPLDLDILQSGASSSITFSFANIVSITPHGHTQMIVQFENFPASDSQNYNDCVYVLDIVKQLPPPTRGLLGFYGTSPVIDVSGPNQPVVIDLKWSMLYVSKVSLICSFAGVPRYEFDYPNETGLNYKAETLSIPSVTTSTPIFFTMQSFDGLGKLLNSLQYAVWVNSSVFIDPRDEQVYPTVLINGLYWMAKNLDWDAPGSVVYGNSPPNETAYGRLYAFAQAQSVPPPPTPPPPPPPPWRLPSVADWNNLIGAAGSASYTALMPGGTTGFNAQLGGQCDNDSDYAGMGTYGLYWASDESGSQASVCKFSSVSDSVNTLNTLPTNFFAAVRYVRNA